MALTLRELQAYIKAKDRLPSQPHGYFLKLIEETGELAQALRKGARLAETGTIKGTVEEELYDVLYYLCALANLYEIDLETCVRLKEEVNRAKWGDPPMALPPEE
jgi:NTP pyrophosphatase (non-canonical NTP hydrolase)